MRPENDPLEPLLSEWTVETGERPLAGRVWREIKRREDLAERHGFFHKLEAVFARPSFAVAFVISCVLLGLFLAEIRVARIQADRSADLARSYIELIHPLVEDPQP